MTEPTVQSPIARSFAAANPIEFDFHNKDDERVLYICDDDRQLQPMILQLRNDSPQDIGLATPDSASKPLDAAHQAYAWDRWSAGTELFHVQLVLRPGVLSDSARPYVAHPAHRLAALDCGWDLHHATDANDRTDRISLLWLGIDHARQLAAGIPRQGREQFPDLDAELARARDQLGAIAKQARATGDLPRCAARQLMLWRLGAVTGGTGRGTRVQLRYANLQYANDGAWVPHGSRTIYVNIVNHQGRRDIPLHVGFAGSNTVLNDGKTVNALKLRITNVSATETIIFKNLPATCFTVSFDCDDQPWALTKVTEAEDIEIEWDGSPPFKWKTAKDAGASGEAKPADDATWHPTVALQGERPAWSFRYVGKDERGLAPGQSMSVGLSEIRCSAPSGYTNLYLQYGNVAGYWDGRFTCLIEKAPMVYRQGETGHGDVRIGTSDGVRATGATPPPPTPKLTVDVGVDNETSGTASKKPAAVFQGGNVGVGTYPSSDIQLHVTAGPWMAAALFDGGVAIQRQDTLDRNALVVTSSAESAPTAKLMNSGKGSALWVSGGDVAIVIESPEAHVKFSGGAETGRSWTAGVGTDDVFKIRSRVAGAVTAADALLTIDPTGHIQAKGRIKDKTGEVMPVGTILAYAGDDAPEGWLLCRDVALPTTAYADLFKVIGYRFGRYTSNGVDHFCVPDLRGRFLRGQDAGVNRDPDRASRKQYFSGGAKGGALGDEVGSVQGDDVGPHRHSLFGPTLSGNRSDRTGSGGNQGVSVGALERIADQTPYADTENKGKETRPMNMYVNFIIKY